ncbi:unnamed protein product [Strongylus vulgaris]|uniref:Uncharacterized protein n=1 Tax=Strongylus vulgaris TaxID=40348 RepID=A0A3P7IU29_STRVU|nr:unnamed protein product [Strongylus vulgaris]
MFRKSKKPKRKGQEIKAVSRLLIHLVGTGRHGSLGDCLMLRTHNANADLHVFLEAAGRIDYHVSSLHETKSRDGRAAGHEGSHTPGPDHFADLLPAKARRVQKILVHI